MMRLKKMLMNPVKAKAQNYLEQVSSFLPYQGPGLITDTVDLIEQEDEVRAIGEKASQLGEPYTSSAPIPECLICEP